MLSVAILGIAAVYVLIYGTAQRSIVQVRDAVEHPHYVPETTQATYDQTLTHRPVPKPADPHQTCVEQTAMSFKDSNPEWHNLHNAEDTVTAIAHFFCDENDQIPTTDWTSCDSSNPRSSCYDDQAGLN